MQFLDLLRLFIYILSYLLPIDFWQENSPPSYSSHSPNVTFHCNRKRNFWWELVWERYMETANKHAVRKRITTFFSRWWFFANPCEKCTRPSNFREFIEFNKIEKEQASTNQTYPSSSWSLQQQLEHIPLSWQIAWKFKNIDLFQTRVIRGS